MKKTAESKALAVVKLEPGIDEKASELLSLAKGKIKDEATFLQATAMLKECSSLIDKIDAVFSPHITAAKALAKSLKTDRDTHAKPAEDAKDALRKAIGEWQMKQQEKAQIAAEKATEKKIAKAEAKGTPIEDIVPVAPKAVEKGELSYRTLYKCRIVDASMIEREYLIPNEPLLNSIVRDSKGATCPKGCEVLKEMVPIER